MNPALKTLRSNSVIQSLDPIEVEEFAGLSMLRTYQKGEYLCLQGDDWSYLFVIANGLIRAHKESEEGRNLLVATFFPGEIFWGLAFFEENAPSPVTLEAHEPSRVFFWSRERCLPFFQQHGAFAWGLCRLMVQRMLHASEILDGLAFQPVASRLARLLLEQYPADQLAAERHLTLDEMAAHIGSTREMVCRILYRFAAQGAIQINRTEFIFKDRQLLEKHT
jgi:CRP/FNR family transcriptional regulator